MRHLKLLDKTLLALFLPLWVVCLSLSVEAVARHTGRPPLTVSRPTNAQAYPVVLGFVPAMQAMDSGLQIGDTLRRVGTCELSGVGPVGVSICFAEEPAPDRRLAVTFERGGEQRQASVAVGSYTPYWPRLPASLVFAATAVLLLLRARPAPMLRAFVGTYMCAALLLACMFVGGPTVTYLSIAVHIGALTLAAPLALRGALLFPHDVAPMGWWARLGPWLFAGLGPLDASRFYEFPFSRSVGTAGMAVGALITFATLLVIMTRTYRHSDPIGRRQMKWFLFGVYCAFLPLIVASALAAIDPRFTGLLLVSSSALGFIPVSLLISVARYNIFDIDRLISTTASYSVLGVVLLTILLTAIPRLSEALVTPMGVDRSTAQILLSVLLAVLLVAAQGWLRPQVDRIFFAPAFALEQGFARLLQELSACNNAQELTALVSTRLDALFRPESCVIYARAETAFSPVFVRGRAIPPAFKAASPLIAALEQRGVPLAADRFSRGRRQRDLDPFDRAALETLGVPAVVPVRRGENLVAFACLGPKRSGDVYTSTDLALLTALADKVSNALLSFDQQEIIRTGRVMQEALRRYVPGAVADQLARGEELEVGTREVSVLFVDIRGYTTYSESRAAQEVFSTVNRYTKTVSEIVCSMGGTVVEFNGDGMMAVFGAPEMRMHKERDAVEAGRKIVETVGALPAEGSERREAPLSVGVGVATGDAFVGNVQAVDRLIWTVIGDTTNLASRLQALTRDLNAAMVIDGTTWSRSGTAADGFQKQANTPIRGRRQPEDVYILPFNETS